MQVKIRKENGDGIVRLETKGAIREVLIQEDLRSVSKENIAICFKGVNSSGIIEFTPAELEELYQSIQQKIHLIKEVKKFKA